MAVSLRRKPPVEPSKSRADTGDPGADRPRRLARRTLYASPWVNLHVDRVAFPGGQIIEQHHALTFDKEAVAVLVEHHGEILFVEAYRYIIDRIAWEIPAGGIDPGESILAAAEREVQEESGWRTTDHRLIYSFWPIPGIGDKVHHIVHCRAVAQVGAFDANEVRGVRWCTRAAVEEMIGRREQQDGYSLAALLLWLHGAAATEN